MAKPTIVVTSPLHLLSDQKSRLEKIGNLTTYAQLPATPDEWMQRTEHADIICSGKYGLMEKIYDRKNVFYSLPFVAVSWIDKKKLAASGNTVSYCPGCNSYAVSEWIIAMTLLLFRKFNRVVNMSNLQDKTGSPDYLGLALKKACILGKGHIGSKVGQVLESMGMQVNYFGRKDNLYEKTNGCHLLINTLGHNPSTEGLLSKKFFSSLGGNAFFVTVTSAKIYDTDAMLSSLAEGKLLGIADDCGSVMPGDFNDPYYKKLISTPKVLATPHTASQSDVTIRISNDMMIDNVEAWISGKPINLL